jgi:hypothetical protein
MAAHPISQYKRMIETAVTCAKSELSPADSE